MTRPSAALAAELGALDGDLLVLGVGGKMGPTLARMAKRAAPGKRVVGVARFSEQGLKEKLESQGVECIPCDLLDRAALERLPRIRNVVFMAGHKFGAAGNPSFTWAMNVAVPFMVAETFRDSRIVAFSTGNVYGLSPVPLGGSLEGDALNPVGEYSISCVGRERIFEHFSRSPGIPVALLRLNYATELRYGVLVDLAQRVHAGEEIDLAMGHFNALWQADANAMALQMALAARLPGPGTATEPALRGALNFARQRQMENPDRKQIVLLVTDGEPASCNATVESTAVISRRAAVADASGSPSVDITQYMLFASQIVVGSGTCAMGT